MCEALDRDWSIANAAVNSGASQCGANQRDVGEGAGGAENPVRRWARVGEGKV